MPIKIKRKQVVETISSIFIILFVYTAVSKLSDVQQFQHVLNKSPIISGYAQYIAIGIPVLELILAGCLIWPKTRKLGLLASSILMFLFTGYIAYMINFTPELPCSCGGVLAQLNWPQHLAFNIFFTILGILGYILTKNKIHLDSSSLTSENSIITI